MKIEDYQTLKINGFNTEDGIRHCQTIFELYQLADQIRTDFYERTNRMNEKDLLEPTPIKDIIKWFGFQITRKVITGSTKSENLILGYMYPQTKEIVLMPDDIISQQQENEVLALALSEYILAHANVKKKDFFSYCDSYLMNNWYSYYTNILASFLLIPPEKFAQFLTTTREGIIKGIMKREMPNLEMSTLEASKVFIVPFTWSIRYLEYFKHLMLGCNTIDFHNEYDKLKNKMKKYIKEIPNCYYKD